MTRPAELGILAPFQSWVVMKKRFIAGVVCPKCGALDSIMAAEDTEKKVLLRECVDCGFTDELSTIVNQPKEMQTRVTPNSDAPVEVQPVKILKP